MKYVLSFVALSSVIGCSCSVRERCDADRGTVCEDAATDAAAEDASDVELIDAADASDVEAPEVPGFVVDFETITLNGTPRAITNLVHVPGTASEFLILEKSGGVHHYEVAGTTATLLGSATVPDVDTTADCGLISAAFDPDFATNGFLFVGSCISETHSRITRHVFDPSDYGAFATSLVEIITVGDPAAPEPWHSIGSIGFEPSGVLWALFGEKNLPNEAQDTTNELGSLVRIVPSRTTGVGGASPASDNPFALDADPTTNANVAAYGLRSPWKGARDASGRLVIGDVGQSSYEEVSLFVPGATTPNFGWPMYEGPCAEPCDSPLVAPLVHYTRSPEHPFVVEDPLAPSTTVRAVWVGAFYEPDAEDRYEGRLTNHVLYGDFCAGFMRSFALTDENEVDAHAMLAHLEGVTGMAKAGDDYLYVTTYGSCSAFPYRPGALYRIRLADH